MRYLLFILCLPMWGQFSPTDEIPLPANKTDATVEIKMENAERLAAEYFVTSDGRRLQPQPTVNTAVKDNTLTLTVKGIYFWGKAGLRLSGGRSLWFRRGPTVAPATFSIEPNAPVQIDIRNYDTAPLTLRWRIVSGVETICGQLESGAPKEKCAQASDMGLISIPPAANRPIAFTVPTRWYSGIPWSSELRVAQLELFVGEDDKTPVTPASLQFWLGASWNRMLYLWLQPGYIGNLIITFLLVSFGAVLLIIAQLVIPGYRKVLQMGNQLDGLQERLGALSLAAGSALTVRCNRELKTARFRLVPKLARATSFIHIPYKLKKIFLRSLLASSPAELSLLSTLIQNVDSRVRLAERLAEMHAERRSESGRLMPISLRWLMDELVCKADIVVSRQSLSQADADASIAALVDPEKLQKLRTDFLAELNERIEKVCKEFQCEPWKSRLPEFLKDLPTTRLCDKSCVPAESGWSEQAIYERDLDTIRLELLYQWIAIETSAHASPAIAQKIVGLLKSSDRLAIESARNLIQQVAQGVFGEEIQKALKTGEWDPWYEPDLPTDTDVLRVSLRFRDPRLNRAAAREEFECYWKLGDAPEDVSPTGDPSTIPAENYERGWDIQLVPTAGEFRLSPEVYKAGERVPSSSSSLCVSVQSNGHQASKRITRLGMDAFATAIVPVATVAITQYQTNAPIAWTTLISLGFTTQAIRAAILPESVGTPPK